MSIKNLEDNKAYRFDCGDWIVALFVTEHNENTATGYVIWTQSAYGIAVCQDVLEEGRPMTLKLDNLEDYEVYVPASNDIVYDKEYMLKVVKERHARAEKFITDGKHSFVMQSIDFSEMGDGATEVILNTGVVSKGFNKYKACSVDERELYQSWMRINHERTKEEIDEAVSIRNNCLSSSGVILPETIINVTLENKDIISTTFSAFKDQDFLELLALNGASDFYQNVVSMVVDSFIKHPLSDSEAA